MNWGRFLDFYLLLQVVLRCGIWPPDTSLYYETITIGLEPLESEKKYLSYLLKKYLNADWQFRCQFCCHHRYRKSLKIEWCRTYSSVMPCLETKLIHCAKSAMPSSFGLALSSRDSPRSWAGSSFRWRFRAEGVSQRYRTADARICRGLAGPSSLHIQRRQRLIRIGF